MKNNGALPKCRAFRCNLLLITQGNSKSIQAKGFPLQSLTQTKLQFVIQLWNIHSYFR